MTWRGMGGMEGDGWHERGWVTWRGMGDMEGDGWHGGGWVA